MSNKALFLGRLPAKPMGIIALMLLFAACQSAGIAGSDTTSQRLGKKLCVVGHRGAAGLAPENTLAAFVRAMEIGVDGVEMDVQLTAEGEVIVHHDFRLKPEIARTADGAWLEGPAGPVIKALTLAELKGYDVGRLKPQTRYARRYPEQQPADGERVPTLPEVVTLLKERNDVATELWLEIKTSPEKPDISSDPGDVANAVMRILREEKVSTRTRILSFDWRSLLHIQEIAPHIPTVYLSHTGVRLNNIKPGQPGPSPWMAGMDVDDFGGSIPRAVKAAGGRHWAPHYNDITYSLLEEAHRLGIKVYVWSPDSPQDMLRLMEMGVDGIITNRPDILKSLLGEPRMTAGPWPGTGRSPLIHHQGIIPAFAGTGSAALGRLRRTRAPQAHCLAAGGG